jgi:molybdopterin-guanine dinucleotide biosynthesis protein A
VTGGDDGARPPFAGAVLAGGRSTRFGRDKCGFRYRGRPLIDRALDALTGAEERWIVGGPRRVRPGVTWVADDPPGRGALAGVRAALAVTRHDWIALVACDMPFVPAELWPILLRSAAGARLVMPEGPDGLQPLAAMYHRDLAPEIERGFVAGRRSPRAYLDDHGTVVPWSELAAVLPPDAFLNANRPEDLP